MPSGYSMQIIDRLALALDSAQGSPRPSPVLDEPYGARAQSQSFRHARHVLYHSAMSSVTQS